MERLPAAWLAVGAVTVGTFICVLNNSLINVALSTLMKVFGVSAVEVQWVLTSFMLTFGVVVPVSGYLAETLGIKRLYEYALLVFVAGSLLGSFAWGLPILIAARVIQAAGAGIIMPSSLTIIYKATPPSGRGLAIGAWGIAVMMAPTIGPTLSGIIVEYLSWRYLFIVNIPIGLIAVYLAHTLLTESPRKQEWAFDKLGFITVSWGTFTLLYALNQTSPAIIGLLVFSAVTLAVFWFVENRHPSPILEFSLFKNPIFTVGVIINSIITIGLFGSIYLIPILVQDILGYTPVEAGLLLLPQALCQGIMMLIGGRILDLHGPKFIVTAGIFVTAVAAFWLSRLSMKVPALYLVVGISLHGLGVGMASMTATTAGLNTVSDKHISRASAMVNAIRQITGSFGVVVLTAIFEFRTASYLQGAGGILTGRITSPAYNHAAALAVGDVFLTVAIITALTIPLGLFLGEKYVLHKEKSTGRSASKYAAGHGEN